MHKDITKTQCRPSIFPVLGTDYLIFLLKKVDKINYIFNFASFVDITYIMILKKPLIL